MAKKTTKKTKKIDPIKTPLNYKTLTMDTIILYVKKKDNTDEGKAFLESLLGLKMLEVKKLFKEHYAEAFVKPVKLTADEKLQNAIAAMAC